MIREKIIDNFDGDFGFLSNFSDHGFNDYDGERWKTNEHFYQAHKTLDPFEFDQIKLAQTPGKAKRLGQKCALRSDWDLIKVPIMSQGLVLKFEDPRLKSMLVSTAGYLLIEGNTWHDNVWGDCKCTKCKNITGMNLLGVTLMTIRQVHLREVECQKSTKGNCCVTKKMENY